MRTTIVIDDNLLEELIRASNSKSRSAAINEAVSDYVSRKKREGILELKGKIHFEEGHLERLREAEEKESDDYTGR
jgi:metal-responsive CopG/Arc/MetJ family transcriptional regulator